MNIRSSFLFCLFSGIIYLASSQCQVQIIPQGPVDFCSGDSVVLKLSGSGSGSVIDQQQTVYNGGTSARTLPGYAYWQSFTAGVNGVMNQIDIGFFNYINGTGYITLWKGQGTAGLRLDSLAVPIVCPSGNCLLSFPFNTPVLSGQVYTIQVRAGPGMPDPYGIQVASPGPYNGGLMGFVDPSGTYPTSFDMVFKTHIASGGPASYLWSTGATDSLITVKSRGNYTVTTTYTGCTATSTSQTVTVYSLPQVTVTADHETICADDSASICATGGYSYQWNIPSEDSCIMASQAGSYFVTVTDVHGCTAVSNHVSLSVYPPPVVSITMSGDTLKTYHAQYYQWFQDNQAIPGANSDIYLPVVPGIYKVEITDSNGCHAVSSPIVYTDISNAEVPAFHVFPNPTNSIWHFNLPLACVGEQLEIYDAQGRIIYTSQIFDSNMLIESAMAPGVYWARWRYLKKTFIQKLIRY